MAGKEVTLDELFADPEAFGFVRIACDKCGTANYYDPEFAKTVTECMGCCAGALTGPQA